MTGEERLKRMLSAYAQRYDIARDVSVADCVFPATATYFLRDENYLVNRRHVLNVVESHEYVYFWLTEHLDTAAAQRLITLTLEDGLQRIQPSRIHMCSFVTLVILAENIDAEAKRLLQKTRYRKNFRLALHGWMEYRTAAMEASTRSFFSNPAGRETRRTLELNLKNT